MRTTSYKRSVLAHTRFFKKGGGRGGYGEAEWVQSGVLVYLRAAAAAAAARGGLLEAAFPIVLAQNETSVCEIYVDVCRVTVEIKLLQFVISEEVGGDRRS